MTAHDLRGPGEFGIRITLYFVQWVVHLGTVIIGTVRASSVKVVRVPFAIPFLRA